MFFSACMLHVIALRVLLMYWQTEAWTVCGMFTTCMHPVYYPYAKHAEYHYMLMDVWQVQAASITGWLVEILRLPGIH